MSKESDPDNLAIPDGSAWCRVDRRRSDEIIAELRREVGPDHPLLPHLDTAIVVASDTASDDVLLWVCGEDRLLLVHPTWSGQRESDPGWPAASAIDDAELSLLMAPDPDSSAPQ